MLLRIKSVIGRIKSVLGRIKSVIKSVNLFFFSPFLFFLSRVFPLVSARIGSKLSTFMLSMGCHSWILRDTRFVLAVHRKAASRDWKQEAGHHVE